MWIGNVELHAKERLVPNSHLLVEEPVEIDIILEERNVWDSSKNINLKVIHTPGHFKGSISIFIQEERVLVKGDLPIYEDVETSIESIKKLKTIERIKVLLASWNDPHEDDSAYQTINGSPDYFQHILVSGLKINKENPSATSMENCKRVLKGLGVPEAATGPIVADLFKQT